MAEPTDKTPKSAEDDSLSVKHVVRDVGEDFEAEGRAIKNAAKDVADKVKGVFDKSGNKSGDS